MTTKRLTFNDFEMMWLMECIEMARENAIEELCEHFHRFEKASPDVYLADLAITQSLQRRIQGALARLRTKA